MTDVLATRIDLFAPVASFRDPMFPGITRGLPVPPPSTLRGLLAAATGEVGYAPTLAVHAFVDGYGRDLETYHPIASDGTNPAIRGRVAAGKGGMTVRERDFLADVSVSLWVPGAEGERVGRAVRRPSWPLRLGRSQDVVHVVEVRKCRLRPTEQATVGHALAPAGSHDRTDVIEIRLAERISVDRERTRYGNYVWCQDDGVPVPTRDALIDDQGRAVWMLPG